MTTNKIIVIALGISLWHSCALSKKYNNISKKLDMIVENSEKGKIDSLQYEIMYLGNKPAPNLPDTIKNPIQLTLQSFKDWSKNQIWKKASK